MPDNESTTPSPSRYFYISSFKDNEITLSVHEKDPIANGATLHLKTEDKNGKIVRSNIDLSSIMDKVDNKLSNLYVDGSFDCNYQYVYTPYSVDITYYDENNNVLGRESQHEEQSFLITNGTYDYTTVKIVLTSAERYRDSHSIYSATLNPNNILQNRFIYLTTTCSVDCLGPSSASLLPTAVSGKTIMFDVYAHSGPTLVLHNWKIDNTSVNTPIDMSCFSEYVLDKAVETYPELSSSLTILDYVNSSSNVVGIPNTAKMCYIDITKNTEFEFPYLEINTFKKFELIINNPNNAYTITFPETVILINSSMATNISNNELLKFTGINVNGVSKWYMLV